MTRLHPFREISPEEAQAILRRFDPALSLRALSPMRGGMCTSNYRADTDAGSYLIKLYARGAGVEPGIYARLAGRAPTPILYYADDACAILEFVEGGTLLDVLSDGGAYPPELARAAGAVLARMHALPAPEGESPPLRDRLSDPCPALAPQTRARLAAFCEERGDVLARIDATRVLCHGDYGYGNILIRDGAPVMIDFEFSRADSPYRDIGKFFRRKDDDLERRVTPEIRAAFAEGYGRLPGDWASLARIADIPAMLSLIRSPDPPRAWVDDIERDVLFAISSYV